MNLSYCCNLTTTPDFSEITNLEEPSLEGCVNLVSVHPSIGMLKRLFVLNMRDCERLQNFPSRVEMDALKVLNLTGCLKVDQLPEALGRIKSLTELHVERNAITKLPSFVSSLINLESLSFGLHMLKSLNLSYCNLVQVPDSIGDLSCLKYLDLKGNHLSKVPQSIGGLSCLEELNLEGNNFTSLPKSFSQLSHLYYLRLDGCKKLEVLPELPHSLYDLYASDCTSLREMSGANPNISKRSTYLINCPKLFKNLAIDSQLSICETQCLDSSITSQGSTNRFSSFLQYVGILNNRCELFHLPGSSIESMDVIYHGNSIPEWFTDKSMGNHAKVELPSDWCYNKFRGFGTCVVFKRKKPFGLIRYSVKNFDGASLGGCFPYYHREYFEDKPIRINESYMIWLHYTGDTKEWKEANNFVTFYFEENNEDIEVKECGARLVCDGDLEQDVTNLSMLQDLPTLSQHGGAMCLSGVDQWTTLYDAHTEIACLMLGSMTPELHRQFELYYPFDMIQELRSMFEKQAGVEKFDLIQSFHACKQEEGKPVADYVLKMKGYVEKLERLGYVLPQDISVGLILNGLTKDFVGFVRNYNMHNMGKTIGEIHAMLIEYEKGLPKKAETPQVMMIKSGKIQKANKKSLNAKGKNKVKGKGKDKKDYIPKPKNPKPTAMERPAKDDACHHCKEVGHWKRNCPVYLAELQKNEEKEARLASASSSVFRIERKLKRGALYCMWSMEFVNNFRLVDNKICFNALRIRDFNFKNIVLYFNVIAQYLTEFFVKRLITSRNQSGGLVVDLGRKSEGEATTPSKKSLANFHKMWRVLTPPQPHKRK
ncbi:NB-ARC domains-containing protein [Tanacetum coccineum]